MICLCEACDGFVGKRRSILRGKRQGIRAGKFSLPHTRMGGVRTGDMNPDITSKYFSPRSIRDIKYFNSSVVREMLGSEQFELFKFSMMRRFELEYRG